MKLAHDVDPSETQKWRDALKSVLAIQDAERTNYLLGKLADEKRRAGDLISEICLAVKMGCDATDIGKTIPPPQSESVGMAEEVFEGVCTRIFHPAEKR